MENERGYVPSARKLRESWMGPQVGPCLPEFHALPPSRSRTRSTAKGARPDISREIKREGATPSIYRAGRTNVVIRRWAQTNGTDCPGSARMASYMQAACSLAVKQSGNLILELNISTVIPHPRPK